MDAGGFRNEVRLAKRTSRAKHIRAPVSRRPLGDPSSRACDVSCNGHGVPGLNCHMHEIVDQQLGDTLHEER